MNSLDKLPQPRFIRSMLMYAASILAISILFQTAAPKMFAQGQKFSIDAYQRFQSEAASFTPDDLLRRYPVGALKTFAGVSGSTSEWRVADFAEQLNAKYRFTPHENVLLQRHNFMVTERLSYNSFGDAFLEIWHADLPVFVSADAILQAMHASYRTILPEVETNYLGPQLTSVLAALHRALPALEQRYATEPAMRTMLRDVDVYLTIPRLALDSTAKPYFAENQGTIDTINAAITALQAVNIKLFSTNPRKYDFSQFQVRGHYTQSPYLRGYFRAMMWLGRTELYLIKSVEVTLMPQDFKDIQRQIIDAALIAEAFQIADSMAASPALRASALHNSFDSMINALVGESDNVQMAQLREVLAANRITRAAELLDDTVTRRFKDTLARKPFAEQRINSQILFGTEQGTPNFVRPAASFLLSGQRFIIDSYLTGNVVHDKVPFRMLPAMQDVLFGLGNNASAQILYPELTKYQNKGYIHALASARYLVDGYDETFWNETLHNLWLNCLRTLNPPQDRSQLPAFMQTGAFWQEKMNTQLASWAELRHGNVLYAKQSFSGAFIGCSFPNGYVEPIPEFYAAIRRFAEKGADIFSQASSTKRNYRTYFTRMKGIADTLENLARKELRNELFTEREKQFLRQIVTRRTALRGCDPPLPTIEYDGWYFQLFFSDSENLFKKDYVVVDVHTAPTDETGNPVGWVQHVGVGPVNMAVVVAPVAGGCPVAFAGPVMSYYEHLTTNFKRLTDEDWLKLYDQAPSVRPSWVNIYLADKQGNMRSSAGGLNLTTSVQQSGGLSNTLLPQLAAFPNPARANGVMLQAHIGERYAGASADMIVFTTTGREVTRLFSGTLPTGTLAVKWNGTDAAGIPAPTGQYLCVLRVAGGEQQSVSIILER